MNNINKLVLELKEEGASQEEAEELALLSKNLSNAYGFERSFENKVKFLNQKYNASFFALKKHMLVTLFAVLLFIVFSTVVSAQDALPGQPLYSVKRASEDLVSFVNPSFKGDILIRRSDEIKKLSNEDNKNEKDLLKTIKAYEQELGDRARLSAKQIEESRVNLQAASKVATNSSKLEIEHILMQTENRESENHTDIIKSTNIEKPEYNHERE